MQLEENKNKTRKWFKKKRYWALGAFILVATFSFGGEADVPPQPASPSYDWADITQEEQPIEESPEVDYLPQKETLPRKECHPSYSGCLNPHASDYDCAGGSGNGPYYTGPVRVYGPDVFGLDRDRDGWGCE